MTGTLSAFLAQGQEADFAQHFDTSFGTDSDGGQNSVCSKLLAFVQTDDQSACLRVVEMPSVWLETRRERNEPGTWMGDLAAILTRKFYLLGKFGCFQCL